jgi:hypothetical protein
MNDSEQTNKPEDLYSIKEEVIESLEDLDEANGKISEEPQEETEEVVEESTAEEEVDLGDLDYADGKERSETDIIQEKEKLYGVDLVSPFKTADIGVFREKLEIMPRDEMGALAERVAARVYSTRDEQVAELMRAFKDWTSQNGFIQTDASKVAEKGVRSDAFGDAKSVNELEERLKQQSLSDLQSVAARLGFNPGFDRDRIITLITNEFLTQS